MSIAQSLRLLEAKASNLQPNAAESETPQTYNEALLQPDAGESEFPSVIQEAEL